MKSYTDLEQSKKLAKILSHESADMHYSKDFGGSWFVDLAKYTSVKIPKYVGNIEEHLLPCWSLAALLDVLPHIQEFYPIISKINDKYICRYKDSGIWTNGDNPIDACVVMIEKMNELKML